LYAKYKYRYEQADESKLSKDQLVEYKKFKEYKEQVDKKRTAAQTNLDRIQESIDVVSNAIGAIEKANGFYKKYEAERDTLMDQSRAKIFAEIDLRYQTEKKEAENKFLKTEQLKNRIIIRQRTLVAMGVGLGLFVFSCLSFLLYYQNRKKVKYNQLLEEQVEERTKHINEANERLVKANQELERFAYITSHDLKEPLRNISGFSSLIQRELKKGKLNEVDNYLNFIIKNTGQMNTLIDDVMAFSKIGNKKEGYKMIRFSKMMSRVENNLATKIKETNTQIVYASAALSDLEKNIYVPVPLAIVFKNLVENGIKYNESEIPQIKIDYKEAADSMTFSITDNGIGIDKKYHDTIFEMFKRLHNRNKYDGSGIGLAICSKTIENIGGDLKLFSEPGKGSTFEFCIPKNFSQEVPNVNVSEDMT